MHFIALLLLLFYHIGIYRIGIFTCAKWLIELPSYYVDVMKLNDSSIYISWHLVIDIKGVYF